jgi:hypothetical protein
LRWVASKRWRHSQEEDRDHYERDQ